jgi:hypothetical protein
VNSVKVELPLFLDKAGALSYTSAAVTPQYLSISADDGASAPQDLPERESAVPVTDSRGVRVIKEAIDGED